MVVKNKKDPVTCIIGGSKVSTKIGVISNLIKKSNNIIIVGAMANNFLAFKDFEIENH
jgi:phosphoglycerate kinase